MPRRAPGVFWVAAVLVGLFVVVTATWPARAREGFSTLLSLITRELGWLLILAVASFLVIAVVLGLSRWSSLRLGPDDAEPEFSRASWLAMLFAAGIGIGLVFFGVAEPLMHFEAPTALAPGSTAAARAAMVTTFFHWGLHAWAIYAVVGLSLAYFHFRHDRPLAPRSTLVRLLGRWTDRWPGQAVDVLAVFGTLFVLA